MFHRNADAYVGKSFSDIRRVAAAAARRFAKLITARTQCAMENTWISQNGRRHDTRVVGHLETGNCDQYVFIDGLINLECFQNELFTVNAPDLCGIVWAIF